MQSKNTLLFGLPFWGSFFIRDGEKLALFQANRHGAIDPGAHRDLVAGEFLTRTNAPHQGLPDKGTHAHTRTADCRMVGALHAKHRHFSENCPAACLKVESAPASLAICPRLNLKAKEHNGV